MKKILSHLLLLLMLAMPATTLTSCGSDDPDPKPVEPVKAANTVFVFMPYTASESGGNNLYNSLLNNISDMEKAIVEMGGINNAHLIAFVSKNEKTSHLINIEYKKGKCVRDTVKTYTGCTYTTVDGLLSLFADVKRQAPADVYSMIVGCHGEGWLPKDNTTTRYFGGQKYQIDVPDLAKAMESSGLTFNYILFDDCYMSGIEVAYALRNTASWLIASTSEMMGYGMPYHKLMKYLLQLNPDYEAICNEFIDFYRNYKNAPYGTIGITKLTEVESMANLMKNINAAIQFNDEDIDKVQDLDVDHFTPTVYFDFGSYVKTLCANDPLMYGYFEKEIAKLVPYKAATEYIYSNSGNTLRVNEFSGLTISDPSPNSIAIETKKQTAWWKATHN